jgi:hypothetical protein
MARLKNIPETQIRNSILHWLNMQPTVALAWQNDSLPAMQIIKRENGTVFGRFRKRKTAFRPNGISDILGILTWPNGGRLLAIEVKSKTGKASPEQIEFLNTILMAGGIGGICRSIEDAEKIFKEAGLIK